MTLEELEACMKTVASYGVTLEMIHIGAACEIRAARTRRAQALLPCDVILLSRSIFVAPHRCN